MCSFDELILRETKECIQKWWKCEVKFDKLNVSSKEFISIKIDGFDDFIKACGIWKRSEVGSFRESKYQLTQLQTSYTKTSNNIRFMYLEILLYTCQNQRIPPLVLKVYK